MTDLGHVQPAVIPLRPIEQQRKHSRLASCRSLVAVSRPVLTAQEANRGPGRLAPRRNWPVLCARARRYGWSDRAPGARGSVRWPHPAVVSTVG